MDRSTLATFSFDCQHCHKEITHKAPIEYYEKQHMPQDCLVNYQRELMTRLHSESDEDYFQVANIFLYSVMTYLSSQMKVQNAQ